MAENNMNYDLPVFSGDFASRYPLLCQLWTIEMAEEWCKATKCFNKEGASNGDGQ